MRNKVPTPPQLADITYQELDSDDRDMAGIDPVGRANREELPGESAADSVPVTLQLPDRIPASFTSIEASTEQYTLGTAPVKIASKYGKRARVTVYNTEDSGGENVWIGFRQGMSASNGFLLKPDKALVIETEAEVYALSTTTGATVCVITERF